MYPGFADPATAAKPPAGDIYFALDSNVGRESPGESPVVVNLHGNSAQQRDTQPISLMFGNSVTGQGEAIVSAAAQSGGRGHVSEILNFHGSPAPWILIGILLAAGLLHLEAKAKVKL